MKPYGRLRTRFLDLNLTERGTFLRHLIAAGLTSGLPARDAFNRALAAITWVRHHIPSTGYTHRQFATIRTFCRATMCTRGAESGEILAARAIEAARLYDECMTAITEREQLREGDTRHGAQESESESS